MTDRFHSLTVVFERNIRDDDAQATIDAIKQLRGVLTVEGNVSDIVEFVAEERVRREMHAAMMNIVRPTKVMP